MKNANIDNGKQVLRGIIESIDRRNDTSGWDGDEISWTNAIEDAFEDLRDTSTGDDDLCDLLAFVLSKYDGDTAYTVKVACYGLAYAIADAIICSREFGEQCYLLQ